MQLTVVIVSLVFALIAAGPHPATSSAARRISRLENIHLLRSRQSGLLPKEFNFVEPRQSAYEDEQAEYEDAEDDDEEAEEELQFALGIAGSEAEEEADNEADDAGGEEYDDELRKFNVEARIFKDRNIEAEDKEETMEGYQGKKEQ